MTTETARSFYRRQGWNPSYGHKVKMQGRLVAVIVNGKELIDVEQSIARMAATADPAKSHMAEVNENQRTMHRGTQTPEIQNAQASPSKNATFMQAKTAREVYEAKSAQLDFEERSGKLIRVDAVKAALANVFSATRDAMLQIPARLGPQLAAESDPAAAQSLLHAEIHQALQLLAGAADRVGRSAGASE